MTNSQWISALVQPYGPQAPIDHLVREVNKLYHHFEAPHYDATHPEIHQQLPPFWAQMIEVAARRNVPWRILDFGCGSGFEAQQLLAALPSSAVGALTCYDPSLDMLDRCRAGIAPSYPRARFCSDLCDVAALAPYNLLATNSLLHHLPDPLGAIEGLLPMLAPEAVWIAGHEPSSRFYRNPECLDACRRFRRRRLLFPETYSRRIKRILGVVCNPLSQTARQACRDGLFRKQPPPRVIDRLVDYHVAHSAAEAASGRGFDIETLQMHFAGSWRLEWTMSYHFLGGSYEADLPARWALSSDRLQERYPLDGANFCAVWSRK